MSLSTSTRQLVIWGLCRRTWYSVNMTSRWWTKLELEVRKDSLQRVLCRAIHNSLINRMPHMPLIRGKEQGKLNNKWEIHRAEWPTVLILAWMQAMKKPPINRCQVKEVTKIVKLAWLIPLQAGGQWILTRKEGINQQVNRASLEINLRMHRREVYRRDQAISIRFGESVKMVMWKRTLK